MPCVSRVLCLQDYSTAVPASLVIYQLGVDFPALVRKHAKRFSLSIPHKVELL